jgi:UDP-glucose 4-epimerase
MNHINVDASARLADAAAVAHVKRFIFLSSIKVNGLTSGDRPFTADDEPRPTEPYGKSKLAAESALRKVAAASNLELVILRPGLVYGPNPRGSVLQLMRIVDRGFPRPLASVNNRRSLLAVQNLCDLIQVCLDHPGAAGNTFSVGRRGYLHA